MHPAHTTKNPSIEGPDSYINPGPEIFIADWLLRYKPHGGEG